MSMDKISQSLKEINLHVHPGDQIIDRILHTLSTFELSIPQRHMCDIWLSSMLHEIYKEDLSCQRERVMKKYGFDSVNKQSLFTLPRNLYSDFVLYCFTVVLAMHIPNAKIIFNSSNKGWESVALTTMDALFKLLHVEFSVNDECDIVDTYYGGNKSRIYFHSITIRSLRGYPTIIIYDNLDIFQPVILNNHVIPLYQLDYTMIGIASESLAEYIENSGTISFKFERVKLTGHYEKHFHGIEHTRGLTQRECREETNKRHANL